MEVCRLWGMVCSSLCCIGLFHIFLSICYKEFPNSDSCKYLERILSQKCLKRGRRNASMKEKPVEKNTDWVWSANSRCSWSRSAVVHSHFPRSSCCPSQPVAGWLLEHIRNRQHWSISGCCSFPCSLTVTNVFWALPYLKAWAGQ